MCYSATKIKYDFLIMPYYRLPINIDMSIVDTYRNPEFCFTEFQKRYI
jgi:hypothetical protein